MSIKRQEDGRWLADVEPVKGKRFRRRFKTKAEAVRFEAMVQEHLAQNPDWKINAGLASWWRVGHCCMGMLWRTVRTVESC